MAAEIRILALVFAALLALLAATLAASFLPLGPFSPLLGFGIAAAKAGLIFWFFMGGRDEAWSFRFALGAGGLWLLLLVALTLLDLAGRGWLEFR